MLVHYIFFASHASIVTTFYHFISVHRNFRIKKNYPVFKPYNAKNLFLSFIFVNHL